MAQKLTKEEVEKRFKELYNGEYKLLTEYTNNSAKYKLLHLNCNTEFEISKLTRFFNQTSPCPCPECKIIKIEHFDFEKYSKKLEEDFNGIYKLKSFEKMKLPAEILCTSCNSIFKINRAGDAFLKGRFRGCPNCIESLRGKHQVIDNYLESIMERCSDSIDYEWKEEYKGKNNIKHKILHKKCGNEYDVRPNDFLQGYRCPHCAKKSSKNENFLLNSIKEIYKGKIIQSERSKINPYELDIFLPEKNIAIEYNGLYWHNEKQKGKFYHRDKLKKCQEKNIRLIQIFEDEFIDNKEIVISKLKSILGIFDGVSIGARKCICKDITNETKLIKDFLDKNHIQGYVTSSKTVGLFYKDELVSVCCFSHLRNSMNKNNINNSWDLIRFASDINKNIIGGCSKLINYFTKIENVKYIKTLADLRWSDEFNNMYLKMGFTFSNRVDCRYFYTDGHKRIPRFNYRKDKIKEKFPEIYDESLTEFEMMDKTYLNRIWDAGKITYEKYF